jgi:TonB family protein
MLWQFWKRGNRRQIRQSCWQPTCLLYAGVSLLAEEGVVNMGFAWGKRLSAVAVTLLLAGGLVVAQQSNTDEGKRKVKYKVAPQFSDLARKMNITGKVRIEIVIAPDGHVKSSKPIGGHPVLVQSCLDAIKDWKFEAAPEETTQVVEFDFKPQ